MACFYTRFFKIVLNSETSALLVLNIRISDVRIVVIEINIKNRKYRPK